MMDVQPAIDKMLTYSIDMKNTSEDSMNEAIEPSNITIKPSNITIKPRHTERRGFFSGFAYGLAHMVKRAFNSGNVTTAIRPINHDGRPNRR